MDEQQKEEEILLERYLNGDNTAFGPLYYRYRGLVLYYLNKRLSYLSIEDKEDLVIDFLGRISSKLNLYDKEKSLFRTWITNCILHFIVTRQNTGKMRFSFPFLLSPKRKHMDCTGASHHHRPKT